MLETENMASFIDLKNTNILPILNRSKLQEESIPFQQVQRF